MSWLNLFALSQLTERFRVYSFGSPRFFSLRVGLSLWNCRPEPRNSRSTSFSTNSDHHYHVVLTICQFNYSLSGALHPVSKLIICAVMLRGRHRGLPNALDRAVILPQDLQKRTDGPNDNDTRSEHPQIPNASPLQLHPPIIDEVEATDASYAYHDEKVDEEESSASSSNPAPTPPDTKTFSQTSV